MNKKDILIALAIALVIGFFLSPLASSFPDGLEWVAEKLGFIEKGKTLLLGAPVPDYTFPFVKEDSFWATSLAGLAGTLLVFVLMYAFGVLLRRKTRKAP